MLLHHLPFGVRVKVCIPSSGWNGLTPWHSAVLVQIGRVSHQLHCWTSMYRFFWYHRHDSLERTTPEPEYHICLISLPPPTCCVASCSDSLPLSLAPCVFVCLLFLRSSSMLAPKMQLINPIFAKHGPDSLEPRLNTLQICHIILSGTLWSCFCFGFFVFLCCFVFVFVVVWFLFCFVVVSSCCWCFLSCLGLGFSAVPDQQDRPSAGGPQVSQS